TEAPIHHNVKQQIVDNTERDTVIVFREFHNSARVARNSVSEEILDLSRRPGAGFGDIAHLASGVRGREQVYGNGDVEGGLWWASQAQGLIHDIGSCEEVVDSILTDAQHIITRTLRDQLAG
ncbi:nitronate monooxygenase, partial [Rhodococcus koreensis]|uniref:nitronate monooxygenase n=1 Tax=Rhodococcus koreensis TaxID=99653 RepID=UPI0036D77B3D